jgi:hypothetical protein
MRTRALVSAVTVLLLTIALAACNSGDGGPAAVTSVVLPETGQTACYDAAGAVVACTDTGQDGDTRAGVAWPSPRFTNSDGTAPVTGSVVVDQLTGLMWLRDANCIQTRDAANPGSEFDKDGTTGDGAVTWQHALDFVAGISAGTYPGCGGGHTDWRLPNRKELRSLINYGQMNTAVWLTNTAQGFSNVYSGYYWSSTTHANYTGYARVVDISVGNVAYGGKSLGSRVWPVRSGQ